MAMEDPHHPKIRYTQLYITAISLLLASHSNLSTRYMPLLISFTSSTHSLIKSCILQSLNTRVRLLGDSLACLLDGFQNELSGQAGIHNYGLLFQRGFDGFNTYTSLRVSIVPSSRHLLHTIDFLQSTFDGSRATAAGHGDVEWVLLLEFGPVSDEPVEIGSRKYTYRHGYRW